MSEPFIGEIQMFGFNFNPYGWAFCNGGTMPIAQNTALFSLLGIQYGGNGTSTFQLPNFAGRAGCQQGQGPGLSTRQLGESFGTAEVALASTQMPVHSHGVRAWSQTVPGSGSHAPVSNGGLSFLAGSTMSRTYGTTPLDTQMAPNMLVPNNGGGFPHQNRQPYLGVNFCIALQGIFPSFP
ncbi:tail fiber protein [Luteimonas sp. M1R5S18]|uniref:Tail fiber protein n=1 Tax=Luteimonas rhizosphaericola TaxID=3042024 RepID=A0ABT6JE45_9GAMM|nr:tail fiber protein [Luteimonas rhizosphaericola]MDH5828952.1 tail fiber protein [Luteimonas rhizosphaericola]